jgi:hypothetical protein
MMAPGRALVVLLAGRVAAAATTEVDPIVLPFEVVAGTRQLFMDEAGVATAVNVAHTMHSPQKKGAVIRPHMRDTPYLGQDTTGMPTISCQVRCAPLWIEKEHHFRFLVANCDADANYSKQWFASPDGIQWTREAAIADRTDHAPGYMVVYDPNSTHPYKSMESDNPEGSGGGSPDENGGLHSKDGLTWSRTMSGFNISTGDEQQFSYDPPSGRYIYTVKRWRAPFQPERAVAVATTTDFYAATWTGASASRARRRCSQRDDLPHTACRPRGDIRRRRARSGARQGAHPAAPGGSRRGEAFLRL